MITTAQYSTHAAGVGRSASKACVLCSFRKGSVVLLSVRLFRELGKSGSPALVRGLAGADHFSLTREGTKVTSQQPLAVQTPDASFCCCRLPVRCLRKGTLQCQRRVISVRKDALLVNIGKTWQLLRNQQNVPPRESF